MAIFLDCLIIQGGTYELSWNISNYQWTQLNNLEGWRPHLHCGKAWNQESLNSFKSQPLDAARSCDTHIILKLN